MVKQKVVFKVVFRFCRDLAHQRRFCCSLVDKMWSGSIVSDVREL